MTPHKGHYGDPGNTPSLKDRFSLVPSYHGCSLSLQEPCLMMRWSNLLFGTTHCNDATLARCCSCTESTGAPPALHSSVGTVIKARERPYSLFFFTLFAFQSKWVSLPQIFFYRSCKKSVKCDLRYYLALWPVVKHQLSWRALLLLSEERLACKFLSNPYYAYLLVL